MSRSAWIIVLALFATVAAKQLHLRHDWAAGKLFTDLAKTIDANQSNCTKRVYYHRQNNWGMGSDVHTWSQAICNSMQASTTLLQQDEKWIWNDLSFCPNVKQPLGCYFNIQKYCPGSVANNPRIISWKHDYDRCPKYIRDDRTRQEFRAAAMEYLFSRLDRKLVDEAEKEITKTFGEEGIPADLITCHLRWGDKKLEMKLVSQEEFVAAIDGLAKNYSIAKPKVFITTESQHALESMQNYVKEHRKSWTLYNFAPSVYETRVVEKSTNQTLHHNPMALAHHTGGKIGKASIIALMLAMEAKYYVLTSGSNWSRLIDELRRNVVNQVCGNCTIMVDLREAFRDHNWRHLLEADSKPNVMSVAEEYELKDDVEDGSELTDCCMKDSPPTWLDKWSHMSSSTVKSRMQARRNAKGKASKVILESKRVTKKSVIASCSLASFVNNESMSGDTYSIQFHAPDGLGLSLFVSYEGVVTVEGMHYLRNGSTSPAQLCGLISTGDQLVRFNDINIEALNFYATTNLLKDLDKYAKDVVTLGFRYGDHPSPLPPEAESDLCSEDSDSEDDGRQPLTLVTCQDQLRSSSAASTPAKTVQQDNRSNESTPARGRSRRSKGGGSAKLAAITPREDAQLQRQNESFLSIFGEEGNGGTPTSANAGAQSAFSGVLQGLQGSWASGRGSGDQQGESWRTHSELAQAQQFARSRHLYPSAARLSALNIDGTLERQLQAIADDIFEWRPFQLSYMYAGYYIRPQAKTRMFPPGLEVPFSTLILSPPDTARYRDTEHLVWDDRRKLYVPVKPPTAEQRKTIIDHRHAMQSVLMALEIESRRRAQQLAQQDPLTGSVRKLQRFEDNREASSVEGFFVTDFGGSRSRNNTADSAELNKVPRLLRCSVNRPASTRAIKVSSADGNGAVLDMGDVRVAVGPAWPVPAPRCKVTTGPYISSRGTREHPHGAYFKKTYDHIISKEHSAVRNLLAHNSEEVLSLLNAAVDSEIYLLADRDSHENPYDNARHLETNLELSLPSMLLTYQVLYVVQDLQIGIFNDPTIYTILEKWATTFNPRGLLTVLQTMSHRTAAQAGYTPPPSAVLATMAAKPHHHLQDRKAEFTVYFGDNRATARNLQVFLEVVSELLTLLTLGRMDPTCILRAAPPAASSERSSWTHLPVRVQEGLSNDVGGGEVAKDAQSAPTALAPLEDAMTAGYVRKFGSLLRLEIVAGICCTQTRRLTLAAVLQAASTDAVFAAASTQLRSFVQKTHSAVVSAAQLLEHVQTFTRHRSGGSSHSYPLLLCLFLSNLRFLFAHNTALALDLAVTLFPRVSPWNVQTALFGGTAPENSDSTEHEPALVQAHSTYYSYITRLMRSHADVCARDAAMVLAWLNLALQLDAENSEPSDGVKCGFFATPSGKRKSSYLVTVRNILHPSGEYVMPLVEAMRVCAGNAFPEGVLILCDRWLQQRTQGVSRGRHQPLLTTQDHSTEVRQLLEGALGTLVSELVFFVHASENNADGNKARGVLPLRCGSRLPHEDEPSPVLSHLCDLLAQCVHLLRDLYLLTTRASGPARNQSQSETGACEDIGRLLNLLLEGSLEGIAPAEENEVGARRSCGEDASRTQRRVAHVCAEVLLGALDVRGALAAARQCLVLLRLL